MKQPRYRTNTHDLSRRLIAQGALTNSKRPEAYVAGVFPTHFTRGSGPFLIDEGNIQYLDFVGGLGTNLLGYDHPAVTDAACSGAHMGPSLSFPSILELEVAKKFADFFNFPKWRFYKTGTEACMAALRIARAHTRRPVVYSEGYHGWSDEFTALTPPAAGVSLAHGNMVKSFVRDDTGEIILPGLGGGGGTQENLIAAVIIEPLLLDDSQKRIEEVRRLRAWTKRIGALLIFDEIITGLRVPKNTVADWWNIRPDMIILGKAIANGFPLAAIGMPENYDREPWFCSGTYCGEMMSLAAAQATLNQCSRRNVDDLMFYAKRFVTKVNALCEEIGVEIKGYGTRGYMPLTSEQEAIFLQECCKSNVLFGRAFFYSYAHIDADIDDRAINAIGDVVRKIKTGDVKLEGEKPVSSFTRY